MDSDTEEIVGATRTRWKFFKVADEKRSNRTAEETKNELCKLAAVVFMLASAGISFIFSNFAYAMLTLVGGITLATIAMDFYTGNDKRIWTALGRIFPFIAAAGVVIIQQHIQPIDGLTPKMRAQTQQEIQNHINAIPPLSTFPQAPKASNPTYSIPSNKSLNTPKTSTSTNTNP